MDYQKWSSNELAKQLNSLGFSQYSRNFRLNEIKGCHLPNITEQHLKEMGIEKVGHRVLLLKRIRQIVDGETPKPANISGGDSNPSSRPSSNLSSAPSQPEPEPAIPQRVIQRRQQQMQQQQNLPQQTQQMIQEKMTQQLQSLNQESGSDVPSSGRQSKIRYTSAHSGRAQKETFSSQEPPPAESSGDGDEKVTCEYCGRKLPPDAARRHIPVCAKIRGKVSRK